MKQLLMLTCPFFSTTEETNEQVCKTIMGIIDPNNIDNSVTITDILSSARIPRVLYNLGLVMNVRGYDCMNSKLASQYDIFKSVTASIGATFNDTVTKKGVFVEVPLSFITTTNVSEEGKYDMLFLQYYLDSGDYNLEDIINAFWGTPALNLLRSELSTSGISEDKLKSIAKKFIFDYRDFLNKQFFAENDYDATTYGEAPPVYRLYNANVVGAQINYATNVRSSHQEMSVMERPCDEIPLTVPEYYEIACQEAWFDKESAITETSDDTSTSVFTNLSNEEDSVITSDFEIKSIYKPVYQADAAWEYFKDDTTVPIINPTTINVASITQFWDVNPANDLPADSFNYCDDGKRYTLEDLVGDASNNRLPLQQNEKKFYTKLNLLYDIAISVEKLALSDEVFEAIKDTAGSTVVDNYLKTLSEQAFNLCWCHTGTTQSIMATSDNEPVNNYDSDSDSDSDTYSIIKTPCRVATVEKVDGSYVLKNKFKSMFERAGSNGNYEEFVYQALRSLLPSMGLGFDGSFDRNFHADGALIGFIDTSGNPRRWIDTLIRLLRWGNRKPTVLTLAPLTATNEEMNQCSVFWDLNTGKSTRNDGCFTNYEAEIDPDTGNQYSITGIVYTEIAIPANIISMFYPYLNDFISPTGVYNLPIGIQLTETLHDTTNTENDSELRKSTFMDIFQFCSELKKGKKFDTVSYSDGKFIVKDDTKFICRPIAHVIACVLKETIIDDENNYNKFIIAPNEEITLDRSKILNEIGANKVYTAQVRNSNLFTAINSFTESLIKLKFQQVGKELEENHKVSENSLVNVEDSRLIYKYLGKLIQLRCNLINTEDNTCEIDLQILLDAFNNLRDSSKKSETLDNSESHLKEILKQISKTNPTYPINFIKFTSTNPEIDTLVIGVSSAPDKNVPHDTHYILTTIKEVEELMKSGMQFATQTVSYESGTKFNSILSNLKALDNRFGKKYIMTLPKIASKKHNGSFMWYFISSPNAIEIVRNIK